MMRIFIPMKVRNLNLHELISAANLIGAEIAKAVEKIAINLYVKVALRQTLRETDDRPVTLPEKKELSLQIRSLNLHWTNQAT